MRLKFSNERHDSPGWIPSIEFFPSSAKLPGAREPRPVFGRPEKQGSQACRGAQQVDEGDDGGGGAVGRGLTLIGGGGRRRRRSRRSIVVVFLVLVSAPLDERGEARIVDVGDGGGRSRRLGGGGGVRRRRCREHGCRRQRRGGRRERVLVERKR